jgi:hypothetical protein
MQALLPEFGAPPGSPQVYSALRSLRLPQFVAWEQPFPPPLRLKLRQSISSATSVAARLHPLQARFEYRSSTEPEFAAASPMRKG